MYKSAKNFVENFKNDDGTYSLYDSNRHKSSPFCERMLVIDPEISLKDLQISVTADAWTGGWEGDNFDISLFDFGHVARKTAASASGNRASGSPSCNAESTQAFTMATACG